MSTLEEVYYAWQNDPNFKKDWKEKGPEQACKNAGIEVDPADLEKIKTIFSGDEELDKRKNM